MPRREHFKFSCLKGQLLPVLLLAATHGFSILWLGRICLDPLQSSRRWMWMPWPKRLQMMPRASWEGEACPPNAVKVKTMERMLGKVIMTCWAWNRLLSVGRASAEDIGNWIISADVHSLGPRVHMYMLQFPGLLPVSPSIFMMWGCDSWWTKFDIESKKRMGVHTMPAICESAFGQSSILFKADIVSYLWFTFCHELALLYVSFLKWVL